MLNTEPAVIGIKNNTLNLFSFLFKRTHLLVQKVALKKDSMYKFGQYVEGYPLAVVSSLW